MKALRLALLSLGLAASVAGLCGAEPAANTITRAREFIGSEKTINNVTSLQFVGNLEVVLDGIKVKPEDRTRRFTIEFIFQKPGSQLMKRSDGVTKEIVGLSDYDGWTRVEPIANPKNWRMVMLEPRKIRRLQASTFDSLNFFAGLEKRGGKIEVRGESKEAGKDVVTLAFIHPGSVVFTRTFDKKTGQLLHTETDEGESFREEGEMHVDGLRFPKSVVSVSTRDGVVQTATISFTEIRVNQKFDSELFAMPSPNQR